MWNTHLSGGIRRQGHIHTDYMWNTHLSGGIRRQGHIHTDYMYMLLLKACNDTG